MRWHMPCRFFCGPNAKKSAALAKQEKKRLRGDAKGKGKGKGAAAKTVDDEDSVSEEDEGEAPVEGKKAAATTGKKRKPAEEGADKKRKAGAKAGKGKGKALSAKVWTHLQCQSCVDGLCWNPPVLPWLLCAAGSHCLLHHLCRGSQGRQWQEQEQCFF